MLSCARRAFRPPRGLFPDPVRNGLPALRPRHHFMPHHHAAALTSGRAAMLLEAALRSIDRVIPDPADLHSFRRALETELEKEPVPLVALITVGRRWMLDRVRRMANENVAETAVPERAHVRPRTSQITPASMEASS